MKDFKAIGQQAYKNREPMAPALNAEVREAIAGMPVGTGAEAIFKAFTAGWQLQEAIEDDKRFEAQQQAWEDSRWD